MDPDGFGQHPFDDFDHVRPMRPSQDLSVDDQSFLRRNIHLEHVKDRGCSSANVNSNVTDADTDTDETQLTGGGGGAAAAAAAVAHNQDAVTPAQSQLQSQSHIQELEPEPELQLEQEQEQDRDQEPKLHHNVLAPSPLEHAHPSPYMSISFAYSTTTTTTTITNATTATSSTDAPTDGSTSSLLHPPLSVHSNTSLQSLSSLSDSSPAIHPLSIRHSHPSAGPALDLPRLPPQQQQQQQQQQIQQQQQQQYPASTQRRQQGPDPSMLQSVNHTSNNTQENPTTPRRISSLTFLPTNPGHLFGSASSPNLPQSPLQTVFPPQPFDFAQSSNSAHSSHSTHSTHSTQLGTFAPSYSNSIATSAAARFSQAFSPLLSSRRKSAVVDMPSTPESAKFPYSSQSVHHSSPGSLHSSHETTSDHVPAGSSSHTTAQQQATSQAGHHFAANFGKISSFSSPRSTRTRRTLPAGINYLSDDATTSYATPPLTATAFHTGLAPHYATVGSASQARELQQESGHVRDSTIKSTSAAVSSSIEKALKKAKVFLDDRAKPKARAASLWSFLDVTFEFDQAKFFQEHADQVFTVTHDSFWHQVDKFKQKPDRSNGLQSKEVLAVQKTLLLLRLIFLYLPDRMKNGWHRRPIANMLAQVLCHKNHPRIRIFGFRLLLLWINDQTVEYPEAIYLFSNAISLDLFMYDGEDLSLDHASASQTKLPTIGNGSIGQKSARVASQYLEMACVNLNQELVQSDGPPICPNPSPPTFQDSIQLFQIFLANIVRMAYVAAGSTPPPGELGSLNSHHPLETNGDIGDGIAVGFGIDAGMAAARFMFDIVKKYYLVKVFPECARNLRLLKDEGKEFGYKTCPPTILRTIIGFVIQYCQDSNEYNSPLGHTSPATPILKSIVYSSEVNREMMHEIVRQGLNLPAGHPQYKDIVRGAIHIVGVWCLSGEEERPAFLRSSSGRSQAPASASSNSLHVPSTTEDPLPPTNNYSVANSFLQRYFQLLTNVFYDKPIFVHDAGSNSSSEALGLTGGHTKIDPDALYGQYKDIIGLFRAIMSRGQIELDEKSWQVLLRSLLEIQRRFMNQAEKYSTPMPPSVSDDLAAYLVETALCAFTRCPNASNEQWLDLRRTMLDSLRWPQAVAQWARWSLRLSHLVSNEVFQVDLESPNGRGHPATGSRHSRKMSDKFRHSRYLSSKTDNPLRHSIGGELLSTQGITLSHPTYSLPIHASHERSSFRRANSVHYDPVKHPLVGSGVAGLNGSSMYAPTLLGHMGFMPSRELGREFHSTLKADVGEVDEDLFEQDGSHISAMGDPLSEAIDDKLSRASSLSFHGPDSLHLDPIVERLSSLYGTFPSPEFIHVSLRGRTPEQALGSWKNCICSLGNPNNIQLPLVKTEVMMCLVDVWDLLNQTRTAQTVDATIIPPLYDFAPWFFEAAKSSNDGGIGLPAIYGGLCRMMSRRYDQDFDPNYYETFYACVITGLVVEDAMIGHSIIANSSRLFNMSLPGSHVLVPPFLNAIRFMMLKDNQLRDGVSHFIRKQAIAILCSVCMLFYEFAPCSDIESLQDARTPGKSNSSVRSELLSYKLTFTRLVLDLTVAEANIKPLGKFWDTHSMLIQLCGILVVNEWNSSLETCDISAESELLLVVLDHLYWTEASIVQSAVEVISTLAGMYQDHEDNGWGISSLTICLALQLILEMVLSHLLSALQEHLRLFQGEARRGAIVSALFRCLTEWLMVIPANVFSETELAKWVFELVEVGLSFHPEPIDSERKTAAAAQAKRHAQTRRKRGPSFRFTGKSIHQHHRVMVSTGPTLDVEIEQQAVKEAAEATLIHLVHFLNNVPSSVGPGTAVADITPTGSADKDREKDKEQEDKMVFALNNSILITLENLPIDKCEYPRTRITVRDETGLYSWDSEIFYKEMMLTEEAHPQQSLRRSRSRLSGLILRRKRTEMAGQLVWRHGVKVRGDDLPSNPVNTTTTTTTPRPSQEVFSRSEAPFWDGAMRSDEDKLDQLLQYIGEKHSDCLFDSKTPLNQLNNGMAMSTGSRYPSTIDAELDRHVQEENYYTRISDPQARAWYDKLVELRSSLIQSEEQDDFQGSNTLMSLVNSNWIPDGGSLSFEDEHPVRATSRRLSSRLWPDVSERRSESDNGDRPILQPSSPMMASASELVQTDLQNDDFSIAKAFQLVLPPEPERPLDSYQHSRLLLSHLGLLCFERFQEHNFVLLGQSASLMRDLASLDKRSGRETFKVALLYVGPGQEGEQVILHNQCGSEAYNRFVNDLGWQVDLGTHSGYMGGLEKNGSNGLTAMYYCSSTLEIIFHEVTRMPTDANDSRQVKKKRHIGNDHVHIVWSEHSRPYDRTTIGGDFGNVLIVLSPIPVIQHGHHTKMCKTQSELVSVEVIRDSNLPVFGPLVDGMVVPVSQLGRLVRQTAIHASKLASAPPPLPPTPSSAGFGTGGVGVGGGAGGGGGGGNAAKSGLHSSQGSSNIGAAMHGHQYVPSSPAIAGTLTSGANSGTNQSTSTSTISASITSLVTSGIAGVSLTSSASNTHGFGANGTTSSLSSSSTAVGHGGSVTGGGGGGGGGGSGPIGAGGAGGAGVHLGLSQMMGGGHAAPHPFKHRAQAIEQIAKRHKVDKWTFQQFMEQVFGYSTAKLQQR
ncbi:Ral GTPase-activating protein subunit alpha-2 [Podila humilis]|nr:Ral GTPase-activating protein subunit alpha-2 [Podila humilis]